MTAKKRDDDDNDDDDNDESDDVSQWPAWPQAKAAAEELGLTQRQLIQLVKQNRIDRYRAPDGSWRYRPESLERFRESSLEDASSAGAGFSAATIEKVLVATTKLLEQAHGHIENLMKNSEKPIAKGIELVLKVSDQQDKRLGQLEQSRDDLVKAREEMLSQESMRTLFAQSEQKKQERLDQGVELLKQHGPKLLQSFALSLAARNPEALAAVKLIQSLDPMFLEVLLGSEFLTPEQRTQVQIILAKKKAEEAAKAAGKPAERAAAEPAPAPDNASGAADSPT